MAHCNGCGAECYDMRYDNYGIPTGVYCDDCYDGPEYPYRRDDYFDPGYAGESLD